MVLRMVITAADTFASSQDISTINVLSLGSYPYEPSIRLLARSY